MKIDVYTKVVLSVIAVCLVWICVINTIPSVQADSSSFRISGIDDTVNVRIEEFGDRAFSYRGTLNAVPVEVTNFP